jgi:dienelactone hydrolase
VALILAELLFGVGHCFGGKYVLPFAPTSMIDAAAAFHPYYDF